MVVVFSKKCHKCNATMERIAELQDVSLLCKLLHSPALPGLSLSPNLELEKENGPALAAVLDPEGG